MSGLMLVLMLEKVLLCQVSFFKLEHEHAII